MFRAPCAHHQEVKIALHNLWYHHTYREDKVLSQPVHGTATYRCDDTRRWQYNFDLLMMSTWCSKHVEAWNKHIVKQKFYASSWLITEINILRCMVSKTSKYLVHVLWFWIFRFCDIPTVPAQVTRYVSLLKSTPFCQYYIHLLNINFGLSSSYKYKNK